MKVVDQRATDFLKVKREPIRRVKEALDAAGINLPEPTYRVRLRRDREPAQAPSSAPVPETPAAPVADIARHDAVERQADAERAAAGPDLLDPAAPRETYRRAPPHLLPSCPDLIRSKPGK
jgi:small conductance mechanosensitive channel